MNKYRREVAQKILVGVLVVLLLVWFIVTMIDVLSTRDDTEYTHAAILMTNGELLEGPIISWEYMQGTNQLRVYFEAGEIVRTDANNVSLWTQSIPAWEVDK